MRVDIKKIFEIANWVVLAILFSLLVTWFFVDDATFENIVATAFYSILIIFVGLISTPLFERIGLLIDIKDEDDQD